MPVLVDAANASLIGRLDKALSFKPDVALPPGHAGIEDFEPLDDPVLAQEQFDELRSRCPVAHTAAYGGYWMLTRHADIKACATNHADFISSVKAVVPSDPRGLRRPPLNTDPPVHTPFRKALDRTLKPARTKRLAQRLEQRASEELAPLLEAGHCDLAEYGAKFAAWVEVEWLNLGEDMADILAETASKWVMAWRDQDVEAVGRYSKVLYTIAEETLADRKSNPRPVEEDPASSLLSETDETGEPLDPVQVLGALRQSLVVGMVAPPILICSIIRHLDEDTELQDQLRNDLSLIPAAVDEFVRLYTPYRGFARTASREVELHGRIIKPGEPITMTYAAANRDPAVFDHPHTFILHRPNISQHLGFGIGKHRCAGMPLAKLSIECVLKVLLEQTTSIQVMREEEMKYARMPELGVTRCPVRLQ